ncbi:uncharacterized protein L3040_002317 [Drepanopeziza brunnea f. sp. 'multigermtubi']|uniref:2EXR domain-containing protein n=1 Tax=Marssonina brunnea f. sp. multigermtubi (strain MB_m1) TaxID=1072389 RepID=K1WQT7_MARBU|nr:uncharacterized protein MBM_01957 [Drepanopeziza brunnea f. sp. 'multigermtubi' MB_m1]EKD20005.1 hypothetical protein MBM_01957 [Drepanopeziza brunnea f. sp. 'multigermtubi' MB_m1]KAJ5050434.1 hypothetical protein L3040_002317 [Drepanopeziza brunnea f. sp. 'multigermtubi']
MERPRSANREFQFHPFPRLPAELRYKIYDFASPPPRLVPITYTAPRSASAPKASYLPPRQLNRDQVSRPYSSYALTTPTPRPPLLQVSPEARLYTQDHYPPLFSLRGLSTPSIINFAPRKDILYFPRKDGYMATFQNFTRVHTLADPVSLRSVERIAVHQDLFVEEEKRRWADLELGRGGLGLELGLEVGVGVGMAAGEERGRSRGRGGIDGVTLQSLDEFWDVLRCKFSGVREVWILEEGAEGRVLREDFGASWGGSEQGLGSGSGSGSGSEDSGDDLEGKWTAGFEVKVAEAAEALETKTGWVAPPWRLLRADADEDEDEDEDEDGRDLDSDEEGEGNRDGGLRARARARGWGDGYLGGNRALPERGFMLHVREDG